MGVHASIDRDAHEAHGGVQFDHSSRYGSFSKETGLLPSPGPGGARIATIEK